MRTSPLDSATYATIKKQAMARLAPTPVSAVPGSRLRSSL